jgi:3-deoxy-D-manno-octulosonate 8-phosphate phosphatase (KDO 8-P phosphatase)
MSVSASDRARKIRVILFDVDGVLTDGAIWFFPSAEKLVEAKGFSAHDGSGISLARIGGIKCGIVTKRVSETVAQRARDLRLEYVYLGQSHKMQAVREIALKESLTLEEIAYVGDDVIDLPVMRLCGLAIAVPNARPQVKAAAHHVTANPGGHGAGRDAIEFVLEAKGILDQCIEKYIDERDPI